LIPNFEALLNKKAGGELLTTGEKKKLSQGLTSLIMDAIPDFFFSSTNSNCGNL